MTARPKLLFVVTEDWYFCSHRLPLGVAARLAGFDVAIATRVAEHGNTMEDAGIRVHRWTIDRGSTGVVSELRSLIGLARIYLREKPDLVHQVALKPALYGSLLSHFFGPSRVVNALGGMGFLFNVDEARAPWLRRIVLMGIRRLLSGSGKILILQNPDDVDLIITQGGVDPASIRLIRGAGVDTVAFDVVPEPQQVPVVVLPARMLRDKGIEEYVQAARLLKEEGVAARFLLAGGVDDHNPTGIPETQLREWSAQGLVEWIGLRNDMPEVLAGANIVCLPSYREGLPKVLLEAASTGRAIVATDVPGCREIVRHGENGLLVPVRDPAGLAAALRTLILDAGLRQRMGGRGRQIVLEEFSEQSVMKSTLDIYSELMQRYS